MHTANALRAATTTPDLLERARRRETSKTSGSNLSNDGAPQADGNFLRYSQRVKNNKGRKGRMANASAGGGKGGKKLVGKKQAKAVAMMFGERSFVEIEPVDVAV